MSILYSRLRATGPAPPSYRRGTLTKYHNSPPQEYNKHCIRQRNLSLSEMGLCDLPGKMQDQIILRLHPSAAVALSQTSRHFHATVSLNRLVTEAVKQSLEERKAQIGRVDGFLCSSCFCLKPQREFLRSQITKKRGKAGSEANK